MARGRKKKTNPKKLEPVRICKCGSTKLRVTHKADKKTIIIECKDCGATWSD